MDLEELQEEAQDTAQSEKENVSLRMFRSMRGGSMGNTGVGELPERVDFSPDEQEREVVPEKVREQRTERVMRGVRRSIASIWREAEPPCPGIAEVRLKVSPGGELESLWITRLQGRSELGEYMRQLIRTAALFPVAGHNATKPVVLDCRFEIAGSVQEE